MSSFDPGFIEKQRIPQNLLRTIRLLGEYKGKEEVFKQQSPQVLETLRHAAVIQSTESSNRDAERRLPGTSKARTEPISGE